jgi:hypothetical protein
MAMAASRRLALVLTTSEILRNCASSLCAIPHGRASRLLPDYQQPRRALSSENWLSQCLLFLLVHQHTQITHTHVQWLSGLSATPHSATKGTAWQAESGLTLAWKLCPHPQSAQLHPRSFLRRKRLSGALEARCGMLQVQCANGNARRGFLDARIPPLARSSICRCRSLFAHSNCVVAPSYCGSVFQGRVAFMFGTAVESFKGNSVPCSKPCVDDTDAALYFTTRAQIN